MPIPRRGRIQIEEKGMSYLERGWERRKTVGERNAWRGRQRITGNFLKANQMPLVFFHTIPRKSRSPYNTSKIPIMHLDV